MLLNSIRNNVTNFTSENNLLTFRLNAPVVIRVKVKEVQTNVAIYSHALLRIHIIGDQRSVKLETAVMCTVNIVTLATGPSKKAVRDESIMFFSPPIMLLSISQEMYQFC